MFEWTLASGRARLAVVILHHHLGREFVNDQHSPVGRYNRALDEATERSLTVVTMKSEWSRIFPFQF
jgi:hypothetical protein